MDIRQWLGQIVQPDAPETLSTQIVADDPAHYHVSLNLSKLKRRHSRGRSDSSLLDVAPQRQTQQNSTAKLYTAHAATASQYSKTPQRTRSESPTASLSSAPFERKARRKTRPERYDPSTKPLKESVKHVHQGRKGGESRRSTRKSKRHKGDKSGNAILQGFQAKNVTGDRLTLKPREQLGIFNKGKTSTAFKGRGLPDLVFSEMRFLQKHAHQPGSVREASITKKKHKNNNAASKEEEISSYFTGVCPNIVEKDGVGHRNDDREIPSRTRMATEKREQSSTVEAALPTIEVPKTATFLGRASRDPSDQSTSCVPWSESIPLASATTARQYISLTTCGEQSPPVDLSGARSSVDQVENPRDRPVHAFSPKGRPVGPGNYPKAPSIGTSRPALSRSHSYPRDTSSPKRWNRIDRVTNRIEIAAVTSPSSMPPRMTGSALRSYGDFQAGEHLNDHEVVQSSSDFEQALQHCNDIFNQERRANTSSRAVAVPLDLAPSGGTVERNADSRNHGMVRRRPSVRFAITSAPIPSGSHLSPSIYERQAQNQTGSIQTIENDCPRYDYRDLVELHAQNHDVLVGNQAWENDWDGWIASGMDDEAGDLGDHVDGRDSEEQAMPGVRPTAPKFWRPHRLY
ncbi:hypothetical protein ACN47E_003085 [Coniothyrium glycines]